MTRMFLGYDMPPGLLPLVVGVISTPEGLEKAASQQQWPCDVVEIRLDLIGDDSCDWPVAALHLTQAGIGTLLTLRHHNEGGRWSGEEADRLDIYQRSLTLVSGLDIELSSPILPDVIALAQGKVTVVGSRHYFRAMPDEVALADDVRTGKAAGVDVVKIAAYAGEKAELSRLLKLLQRDAEQGVCALAMGPMGATSRVELPLAGSCLTYGYLDKPSAPGQPDAATIRTQLAERSEEYRVFVELQGG